MKNYFGRLVSARSGRGVLRPPRMLFGAAPRVAATEPGVNVSRSAALPSPRVSTAVRQGPASAEAKAEAREERVPATLMTPVMRSEVAPARASAANRDEARVRPVSSSAASQVTPPSAAAKAADARPAVGRVVTAAEGEEERRGPERSAAHPPPMRPEVSAPAVAARRTADAELRPASAKEASPPDVPRIPVVPGKVTPRDENDAAMKQSAILRPVVAASVPPSVAALRSVAEPQRQEAPKIEIGTIEVRIAAPQRRAMAQTARAESAARAGTLARRFFHSFGMRQG